MLARENPTQSQVLDMADPVTRAVENESPADIVRPPPARILVADDDPMIRALLADILGDVGHDVEVVEDGQAALERLASKDYDVVLLDLNMPRVSGINVLSALPSLQTNARFIVLTAFGTVDTAVEAMKLGAYDFVTKPCGEDHLLHAVARALDDANARRELARARSDARGPKFGGMIGKTPPMVRVFGLIDRVAPTRATVLITGETGTGKELVARAIHDRSPRASRPFVAVNCSAIPTALLESELFGHTKGSFTGAVQSRKGLIEEAAGGTLFLDEISTLSQDIQVKLLRVLQDRRVQRLGSNTPVTVDFRLVVATNRDLADLVAEGEFREDFFFRLNVFPIDVPPLRERRDDILILSNHFLTRYGAEHGLEPPQLTKGAVSRMMAYDWPGNVRELENFVERAVIMHPGQDDLPFALGGGNGSDEGAQLLAEAARSDWTLERLEREHLLATLERHRWQQGTAAKKLGINRRTIHRKLKLYREQGHLPELGVE